MGQQDVERDADEHQLRSFIRSLLRDVHALERMLAGDMFERGLRRIGAEQEMFLIDRAGRAAPLAVELLDRLQSPHFTTELARFNLEANLTPRRYGGDCLRRLHEELDARVAEADAAAATLGAQVLLTGILPTLRQEDLGLDNMTPNPRYFALNHAITKLRGGHFDFRIKGIDEIEIQHDNVMLESCNTSFQVHFQVAPHEFARLYNLAQALAGPILAASVNSPLLLGRRLWHETRIALFQQSVDARSSAHKARGHRPRVHFGDRWIRDSVLEIFREDVARFRVVLATGIDEDPEALVARGTAPRLTALRLHNGTVYRWNRPCYGVLDGRPHLRIEARFLPAGPTTIDEVANAAMFFGLMSALAEEYSDIREVMAFDDARANFARAARNGLQAQFTWLHGKEYSARELLLDQLLPLARQGLLQADIDGGDVEHYLGVVEGRIRAGMTGANWMLKSLATMGTAGTADHRLRTLCLAMRSRQQGHAPAHRWDLATMAEADAWRHSFEKVGQFMTTDLFTVRPQDVVDLAASLMAWEHIRHVPVEDDEGQLVGLVTHRTLIRMLGRGTDRGSGDPVPVSTIMKRDPITVAPETPTLEAIALMREHRVGCLPVVARGKLVGIITERDLINVAGQLLEQHLREHLGG